MDEQKERMRQLFTQLCRELDDRDWGYVQDEENPLALNSYSTLGEDEIFTFVASIGGEGRYFALRGIFPFKVPKERRLAFAYAIAVHNRYCPDNCIDLDLTEGYVGLRKTSVLVGAIVGSDFFFSAMEPFLLTAEGLYPRLARIAQNDVSLLEADRIIRGGCDNE